MARFTLDEQAAYDHEKAEVRVDLAMAKAVPKVLKHLMKMVDTIETQKDTIQIKLIEKVLGHNKETRKMAREALSGGKDAKTTEEVEDDFTIELDLASEETANKTLN